MGKFINEKDIVNNNIFQYENRMESQYTRFLQTTPTFVDYYKINFNESTNDTGLLTIESLTGSNSPIKFQKISDFPLYGIEDIKLDLNDDNHSGLTSEYSGDCIILPNTITPTPNDLFFISYLNRSYLFIITSIEYDTIKSNNFYKATFSLKDINSEAEEEISKQVTEEYNCVFRNIGTEDKCIIESNEYKKFEQLSDIFDKLKSEYLMLYYDKVYNTLITRNDSGEVIYDKYLVNFVINNKILYEQYSYSTIILSKELWVNKDNIIYETSVYRDLEKDKIPRKQSHCVGFSGRAIGSMFSWYGEDSVRTIDIIDHNKHHKSYLPEELYKIIDNIQGVLDKDVIIKEPPENHDDEATIFPELENDPVTMAEVEVLPPSEDKNDDIIIDPDINKDDEIQPEPDNDDIVVDPEFGRDDYNPADPNGDIDDNAIYSDDEYIYVFIANCILNKINSMKDIDIDKLSNIRVFKNTNIYDITLLLYYIKKLAIIIMKK